MRDDYQHITSCKQYWLAVGAIQVYEPLHANRYEKLIQNMKNSVILILAFILLACSEKSQENTHNIPREKKENVAIDSTFEINKSLDTSNNEIGFDIGYISKGKLFLYNSKLRTQIEFEEPSNIFNCVFDKTSSTLYYTVIDSNDSLSLKMAKIDGEEITTRFIAELHIHRSDCLTSFYGEKSKLKLNSSQVLMEFNFVWEWMWFTNIVAYDIKRKNLMKYKGMGSYWVSTEENLDKLTVHEEEEIEKQRALVKLMYPPKKESNIYDNLYTEEVEGVEELFLAQQIDKIQLSKTDELDIAINNDDKKFDNFLLSPDSSKLLFSVYDHFGDLAHGPHYVVNLNGTEQRKLETDIAKINEPIWCNKNEIVYLVTEYDATNENDLNLLYSRQNLIQKISEDVDYYFVVK